MINKIELILKKAKNLNDSKLSRDLRVAAIKSIVKIAEKGILENTTGPMNPYETNKNVLVERKDSGNDLTGVKRQKSDITVDPVSRSLSTRYSPDRVGVQSKRISDGVVQDPITNKVYDWNEGFSTESGDEISGGSVSFQTDFE